MNHTEDMQTDSSESSKPAWTATANGDADAPEGWRRFLPYLLFTVACCLIHVLLVYTTVPAVLSGELVDTDSYTRLLRVRHLMEGGGWFDSRVARENWPFGEVSHWTRPLDALILAGAWILTPFVGPEKALYWSGALNSPLLQILTGLGLAWAVAPLLAPRLRLLTMIAVLAQPAVMAYALAGRADHHGLILLAFVLALGFMVRAILRPESPSQALWAGVVVAVGMWVSTEFLVPLALFYAVLAIPWIVRGRVWLPVNRAFAAGLTLATGASLLLERRDLLAVEYDRLSLVHLVMAGVSWLFWVATDRFGRRSENTGPTGADLNWGGLPWSRLPWSRLAWATLGGAATVAIFAGLFPAFLGGPWSEVDPQVLAIWLDQVSELQPLWPTDRWELGRFVAYLGAPLVALPYVLWLVLGRERARDAEGRDLRGGWALVAVSMAIFFGLSLTRLRFSTFAEILGAVGLVHALGVLLPYLDHIRMPSLKTVARAGLSAATISGFLFLGGALMAEPTDPRNAANPHCDVKGLSQWMAAGLGGGEARTILAFIDFGPEILYRTPHRVLATPYHRNRSGILGSHEMLATRDLERSRALVLEREVDVVLLCAAQDSGFFLQNVGEDEDAEATVYQRLMDGDAPEWLTPVTIPSEFQAAFRVWEVLR